MIIEPNQIDQQGLHILFDANSIDSPSNEFFEADHWRSLDAVISVA